MLTTDMSMMRFIAANLAIIAFNILAVLIMLVCIIARVPPPTDNIGLATGLFLAVDAAIWVGVFAYTR